MNEKPHILFAQEKFCDSNPYLLTNGFHNVFSSFSKATRDYSFNTIHLDEAEIIYQSHIDKILPEYCSKYKVAAIFYSLIGNGTCNPSKETYSKIRELKIPQCIIWPDTGPGWGLSTIHEIRDAVDWHISWDCPRGPYHQAPRLPNHIDLWTPEDDDLYYPIPDSEKDIDVSMVGSIDKYQDRISFARLLSSSLPNVFIGGGQRAQNLSPHEYASIIRRSKIGINFSLSQTGVFYQAKGRIFEYAASQSLLMENIGPSASEFFTPGEDFVVFENGKDLLDKIQYYLYNSGERIRIATNACKKFRENYSAEQYWNKLLEIVIPNV